jgi:hypothetical protein
MFASAAYLRLLLFWDLPQDAHGKFAEAAKRLSFILEVVGSSLGQDMGCLGRFSWPSSVSLDKSKCSNLD